MPEFEEHHHHHRHDGEDYSRHHHSSSGEHHHHHHYDEDTHSHHSHSSSLVEHHHHDSDTFSLNGADILSLNSSPLEEKTPRETKTAAVIACLLTIFCILPLVIVLLFKNRNLTEENATLRHELGMKMQQIEKLTAASPSVSGNPDEEQSIDKSPEYALATVKADSADEDDDDEDDSEYSDDVDDYLPSEPPAVAIKASAITQEESDAIRRDITLMPNGMRIVGRGSSITKTSDPLAGVIAQAYSFVACGQRSDAAISFKKIVEFKPYWPYGHFYLGLLSGDKEQLDKAAELLEKAELIGASTSESVFYEVLTAFYRKADFSAEGFISRLSVRKTNHEALQVGPALYPPAAPAALIEKLKKIPGMPELVKFTPDWKKK